MRHASLAILCIVAALAPAPPGRAADGGALWKHYIVQSPSTGKIERFWVGHPAGLKADGQYPVIYFLPGLLDAEWNWKAALEPHLAKFEVIAVCTSVGGGTWFINSTAQPWMRWGDFLTDDLRSFVESHYPASREKGQRGIVGISAGGNAAFYHAVKRPDLYGAVSVLSGAMEFRGYAGGFGLDYWIGPRSPETATLYAERSSVVLAGKLAGPLPFALFLDAASQDGALPQMEALRKVLDSSGAKCRWFVGQGAHSWTYWNTRAEAHLAWQAEQFAANRKDGRYPEKAAPKGAELKALASAPPDVALSDEAARRLRAPWQTTGGTKIAVTGLPKDGGPLSKADDRYKEVKLAAALTAQGHNPGLFVYRLTITAGTPLAREGAISLASYIRNGRDLFLALIPATALTVPAGEPQRRAELRARLAIELKAPDPLRGGIVAGLQAFDAAGNPVGDPVLGKAPPGSANVEQWPIAPLAKAEWVLTLAGDKALGLAAIHEVRLEAEP